MIRSFVVHYFKLFCALIGSGVNRNRVNAKYIGILMGIFEDFLLSMTFFIIIVHQFSVLIREKDSLSEKRA